ncbi:DEAD/DEAH box helicase [Bacteriovorax sp. PP10]|uniref:DEAD/DEAH box helicase n=1 Tax=Bacteriovorax antarcticus TaxID=3088717 RepID=A0ABU5VUE1_9BACT|nr:DEAD/DEAH box helicase [Bacteriovorax sp. PP10]MEA9355640.1 DEAD/DEAH box helicase [Bacteriovorax sp. PP10]
MKNDENFKELGLTDELLLAVEKSGFTEPTRIQEITLPLILEGRDLLIEAQTGSGKTACFAWPLLQKISAEKTSESKTIQALILTPTRELALQVSGAFYRFGEFLENKVSVLTVIGGESIDQQTRALADGVDVVVATPGRLLDLIGQKVLSLSDIKFLVLDEADKILDLGFAAELDLVLQEISGKRQNLFFSATYPEKVLEIVKRISAAPEHIKIEDDTPTVENIFQRVIEVNKENRGMLLRHLIVMEKWKNALIFVSSKTAAGNLSEKLKKVGVRAGAIHGDLSQPERNKALSDFKDKKIDFLVATDVAARGIDINKLTLVINFDLPRSPADYIHRIGRTGRAGEKGLAVTFISHEDQEHFKLIEKRAQIRLEREMINGFELTGEAPVVIKGQAPVKGKRKSKKDKARELAQKS